MHFITNSGGKASHPRRWAETDKAQPPVLVGNRETQAAEKQTEKQGPGLS